MAEISQRIARDVALLENTRTAFAAARVMSDRNIGSVAVTDSAGNVKGLFTERDLMRQVVANGKSPPDTILKDVMRRDFVKVAPNEDVERCLDLMREYRSRHLLVFEGDRFVGLVSLRDLVLLLLEEKEQLIQDLTRYIRS
jgi:CBS domain-containing protein